ncbi:unnamed protein product, partial [Discosporangium mesarthrocarpum]
CQLAALGIDEGLELSDGEDDDVDLSDASETKGVAVTPSISSVTTIPSGSVPVAEIPKLASADIIPCPAPPAPELPNDLEEGELQQLLDKPLQSARGPSRQQATGGHRKGDGSGRRKKKRLTIRECAKWVCKVLREPKYYLMCQVVSDIGYNKTKTILKRVKRVEDSGGMLTASKERRRSPGGVFFTLLKEYVDPATLKAIYADDIRVKKERERAARKIQKRKAAEEVLAAPDPRKKLTSERVGV